MGALAKLRLRSETDIFVLSPWFCSRDNKCEFSRVSCWYCGSGRRRLQLSVNYLGVMVDPVGRIPQSPFWKSLVLMPLNELSPPSGLGQLNPARVK